jgi:hypothetical protein
MCGVIVQNFFMENGEWRAAIISNAIAETVGNTSGADGIRDGVILAEEGSRRNGNCLCDVSFWVPASDNCAIHFHEMMGILEI